MTRFILNKLDVFLKCVYIYIYIYILYICLIYQCQWYRLFILSAFDVPKASDTWTKCFKSNVFTVEIISLSILQLQENRLSPLFIALVLGNLL